MLFLKVSEASELCGVPESKMRSLIKRGLLEVQTHEDGIMRVGISKEDVVRFEKSIYNRRCRECGKDFATNNKYKIFCSIKHSLLYHNKKSYRKRHKSSLVRCKRDKEILELVKSGRSMAEVGRMYKLSRARVMQIVRKGYGRIQQSYE